MKSRITDALRASRADYTDIRLEHTWATAIVFRGSRLEGASCGEEVGGFEMQIVGGDILPGPDEHAGAAMTAHEVLL